MARKPARKSRTDANGSAPKPSAMPDRLRRAMAWSDAGAIYDLIRAVTRWRDAERRDDADAAKLRQSDALAALLAIPGAPDNRTADAVLLIQGWVQAGVVPTFGDNQADAAMQCLCDWHHNTLRASVKVSPLPRSEDSRWNKKQNC